MSDSIEELFTDALLEKRLIFPISEVNDHLESFLVEKIQSQVENRCIEEGFVLAKSIRLKQHSIGRITSHGVEVIVLFSCKVCRPVEGMKVHCTVTDITKAGIHADCYTQDRSQHPLTIYILRDQYYQDEKYKYLFEENNLAKNTVLYVKIVGVRYELNDPCIHAIAELDETP